MLSLGRCRLTRLGLNRLDGGVDAERLDDAQNLGADGGVDLNAPDRDAPFRAVVRASAVARVAPDIAAVVHVQLAPAVAAAEQSGQQHLTFAHGAFHHGAAFAHGTVRDHALIALELVPADVALVMIFDQNIAFIDRASYATPHALAAVLDTYLARRAAEGVGTRVDRPPLHPSRRHRKQPAHCSRRARRDLPVQGLPPQRTGAVPHNDTRRRRVYQALPAPHSTKGV